MKLIIKIALGIILALFVLVGIVTCVGSCLDFDDEERETKPGKDGEKSFFERLREDVGVYDEDEEDTPAEEPQGDYDEDDEEEFEDDADFSDSFEEDEDEDEF